MTDLDSKLRALRPGPMYCAYDAQTFLDFARTAADLALEAAVQALDLAASEVVSLPWFEDKPGTPTIAAHYAKLSQKVIRALRTRGGSTV